MGECINVLGQMTTVGFDKNVNSRDSYYDNLQKKTN